MFYISREEYQLICNSYTIQTVQANSGTSDLYNRFEYDRLYRLCRDETVFGILMEFDLQNIKIYAVDLLDENTSLFCDELLNRTCEILRKSELQWLFSSEKETAGPYAARIQEIILASRKKTPICTNIQCAGGCNINVWANQNLEYEKIREYLICEECDISYVFEIAACQDTVCFKQIQSIFNTIQYLFQARTVNKAQLIADGNGFAFFEIDKLVIGYQKYYNHLESPMTYYIIDRVKRLILVFCLHSWDRQVLRAAQALVAYAISLQGGILLHASALVINNYGILLLGEKTAGKTTNMLYGLKYNKEAKIMSNDLVHIISKDGELIGIGSRCKVTIRPKTVALFPELSTQNSDEYSSVGNPFSNNIQVVKTIDELAKSFGNEVQYKAPIKMLVMVHYDESVNSPLIEWAQGNNLLKEIPQHFKMHYSGRERFWNSIFPNNAKEVDFSCFDSLRIAKVVVNAQNIYGTWSILTEIINSGNETESGN